jgi:hypothetical protein
LKVTITNQATNPHTDQTITIYQQTLSISIRVSNGGEEKLKIKGKMRDFLQGVSFSLWSDSGAPKLLIPLANLVDLQLRSSGIRRWSVLSGSATALVWAQWVSRELMISLNLKRARKIWEKERERLIRRGLGE